MVVWWLLYADHRAVFGFRSYYYFTAVILDVSGVMGCLHMSVSLKIGGPLAELWCYVCVIAYE